jgi:hypothetical protein
VAHVLGYSLSHLTATGVADTDKQQSHDNPVRSGFNELNRNIRNTESETV